MSSIDVWPTSLKSNLSILSADELKIAENLIELDQSHLFNDWEVAGVNDNAKHGFFKQVAELDKTPGGLSGYVERARVLLASAKAGENPFDGWVPQVPVGVNLAPMTPEYEEYDAKGIPEIGSCGFVLVAGGLGERLGYNGIKIELPCQTVTNVSYIEHYCQQILSMQAKYAKSGQLLPFAIMVSDDTEAKTRALLESKHYFGMEPNQITLMKQGKVPALLDNDGHIAMVDKYEINAKPHGHGDVHSLLYSTGTADAWASNGIKWIVFFQDTNGLCFYSLPAMLGVSVSLGLEVNSMAIDRAAKQAIGAISKLVHTATGKEMTINVEYNQLDPLLRATTSPDGDVNDPQTGLSPFPGNINHLLFRMEPYLINLHATSGIMPEFVNPKYADKTRSVFKKPTRLECMMQDYPKVITSGGSVGFTTAPAWLCYSPAKNNPTDAAASLASGVPASAPYTAECDQYAIFVNLLKMMGAKIHQAPEQSILGITGSPSPRLVFHPSFVQFPHELKQRFPSPENVVINENSTLILSGDIIVRKLNLKGSLRVDADKYSQVIIETENSIENEGHCLMYLDEIQRVEGSVTEVEVMRGYRVICKDMKSDCSSRLIREAETENVFVFDGIRMIPANALEDETEEGVMDVETCQCSVMASALNC